MDVGGRKGVISVVPSYSGLQWLFSRILRTRVAGCRTDAEFLSAESASYVVWCFCFRWKRLFRVGGSLGCRQLICLLCRVSHSSGRGSRLATVNLQRDLAMLFRSICVDGPQDGADGRGSGHENQPLAILGTLGMARCKRNLPFVSSKQQLATRNEWRRI